MKPLRRRALFTAAGISLAVALSAGAAAAESLADAIALAYQTNPTLQRQRAEQRVLDETVVQARSALRPSVNAAVGVQYQDPAPGGFFASGDNFTLSTSVGVEQPLYAGGRIASGVSAAEADVLQGRESLRAVEAQVLTAVVQAYVDVLRDLEAVRIRQENVGVLRRQLDEAGARFEVGEITRTDVAQAEARLAQAQAQLAVAQAQLSVSRAAYAAVVGQNPGQLAPAPGLPGMPASFEEALAVAEEANPTLRAARYAERAASARTAQARAAFRPTVGLRADYGVSDTFRASNTSGLYSDLADRDAVTARATVSIPIFTGGLNGSRVRQALERETSAEIGVLGARREVLQRVSQAWAQLASARAALAAGEQQVRAARIAAEGVRQEAQVGLRTTLDVLNAEAELREAELNVVRARRDEYVAASLLLAAMGRLEAPLLVQGVETYDAEANYRRVRGRGGLPWDPVVEAVDRVGAPSGGGARPVATAPIDPPRTTSPQR